MRKKKNRPKKKLVSPNKKTKLEEKFENLLKSLNIKYEYQFEFGDRMFDFYLSESNVLIEVDGDFFHCNPTKYKWPRYEIQRNTKKNDKYKNELCKKNHVTLIRYWEKDINENYEWVINDLKSKIL